VGGLSQDWVSISKGLLSVVPQAFASVQVLVLDCWLLTHSDQADHESQVQASMQGDAPNTPNRLSQLWLSKDRCHKLTKSSAGHISLPFVLQK